MAEHIKREAAIDAIMSEPPDAHYPQWYADKIKAIPAADVVPVIFCKYCKHYHAVIIDEKTAEIGDWGICVQPWRNEGYDVNETDYCSSADTK